MKGKFKCDSIIQHPELNQKKVFLSLVEENRDFTGDIDTPIEMWIGDCVPAANFFKKDEEYLVEFVHIKNKYK